MGDRGADRPRWPRPHGGHGAKAAVKVATVTSVSRRIRRSPPVASHALQQRLTTLLDALGAERPDGDAPVHDLVNALAWHLGRRRPRADEHWLVLAVLSGRLPDSAAVVAAVRIAELEGVLAPVAAVVSKVTTRSLLHPLRPLPTVEARCRGVTADVGHTASQRFMTGIQRVVRETARRWTAEHEVTLLGWTEAQDALRLLRPDEQARAVGGSAPDSWSPGGPPTVVVPWRGIHLVPELVADAGKTKHLLALAAHSSNTVGVIGFDAVPVTSAETIDFGMGDAYAGYLAAIRHADRLAAISAGAAGEFTGWRSMLGSLGLPGPAIADIPLPATAPPAKDADLDAVRERLSVGALPVVLCVGSHEPRKNHLAVCHAAELLWRRGLLFSLVFVGGNAWGSERFEQTCRGLQAAGRPLDVIRALPDQELWAAYRVAHCVVFPSLNEGFGLPAAEALACGTPVVTSDFGSMREIGLDGGALLVDPRDDHAIADAMARLLTEPGLHERLTREARDRPVRTWDDYARETWTFLVDGQPPRP